MDDLESSDDLLDLPLRQLVDQFDEHWNAGRIHSIAKVMDLAQRKYRAMCSDEVRQALFVTLVRRDLAHRWRRRAKTERAERAPLLENYAKAFPTLLDLADVPQELIDAEIRARLWGGDELVAAEYAARFPRFDKSMSVRVADIENEEFKRGDALPQIDDLLLVIEKVGQGGFGFVYKARQREANRIVAVKVLRSGIIENEQAIRRFFRECELIARIKHPHVATLHWTGVAVKPRERFLVMEFVGGGTLAERLQGALGETRKTLAEESDAWERQVAELMRDVAQGVSAAHEMGVVHRDLKPQNILFDEQERPKVVDFGFAREVADQFTTEGLGVGTRGYWSPEQARGDKDLDLRTDVFSLGVIFYELLTGSLPFAGSKERYWILDDKLDAPSPRAALPGLHRDLETICLACLEKDREKRFGSATDLAAELDRFCHRVPILRPPLSLGEKVRRGLRRNRLAASVGAILVFVLMVGGVLLVTEKSATESQRISAESARREAATSAENEQRAVEAKHFHEYAADMRLVERSWHSGDVARVRELLEKYDPVVNADASRWRGFEWHYWRHLLRSGATVLETKLRPIRDLAVDASGKLLAATDHQHLSLWDVDQQREVANWTINARRQTNWQSHDKSFPADDSVAISPDGRYLAATGFVLLGQERVGALKVWELGKEREVLSVTNDATITGRAVAFSPDSRTIVAGGFGGGWRSWDLATGREGVRGIGLQSGENVSFGGSPPLEESRGPLEGTSTSMPEEVVRSLRFAMNGEVLFAACFGRPPIAWEWATGHRIPHNIRRNPSLSSSALTCAGEGAAEFISLDAGVVHLHLLNSHSNNLAPDSFDRISLSWPTLIDCIDYRRGRLATGDRNRAVALWAAENGMVQDAPLIVHRGHETEISCVTIDERGEVVSGDKGGTIRIWPRRDPEQVVVSLSEHAIRIREEEVIEPWSGSGDVPTPWKQLTITNAAGQVAGQFKLEAGQSFFWAGVSPDERLVAISLQGGVREGHRLMVWDLERGEARWSQPVGPKLVGDGSFVFSADASAAAAISDERQVTVWPLKTGGPATTIPVQNAMRIALDRSGRQIAIGSGESVSIWSVESAERKCELPVWNVTTGHMPAFVFAADGESVVVEGNPDTWWDANLGGALPVPPDDVGTDRRIQGEVRPRLYQVKGDRLVVGCGRTLQQLVEIPFRWREDRLRGDASGPRRWRAARDETLMAFSPVAGAEGLGESQSIDRLLDELAASWEPTEPH